MGIRTVVKEMSGRMTTQAKTAVLMSVAIHALAFIILMGVKFYYGEPGTEEKIPVTFVDRKDIKPSRRSAPVRSRVLVYKSPQNRYQEQAIIRPVHRSSDVFYTNAPEQAFSIASGVGREARKGQFAAKLSPINKPHRMFSPVGTAVLKETSPSEAQLFQSQITSGYDFLKEMPSIQSRPSLSEIMGRFAQIVRRSIESQKRYPLAARKSRIEGRVGIKMTIRRDGQLEMIEIIESSGHTILDIAALESVRRAAPFPPFPKEAERSRIQMSIYLVFKMT